MNVTINGSTLTFNNVHISMLNIVVGRYDLEQFSVVRGTGDNVDTWEISAPINKIMQKEFAGQIHRANNENKLRKKLDTGNGKPDNTPPKGTPPRGGAGNTKEFVNTMAIAA